MGLTIATVINHDPPRTQSFPSFSAVFLRSILLDVMMRKCGKNVAEMWDTGMEELTLITSFRVAAGGVKQ